MKISRFAVIALVFYLIITFTACRSKEAVPESLEPIGSVKEHSSNERPFPEISVTYTDTSGDDNSIYWVLGMNSYQGMVTDREDNFVMIMREHTFDDLVYLKNGETIAINFSGDNIPDRAALSEYILRTSGSVKFRYAADSDGRELGFELSGGKGEFVIESNFATLLSSTGEDYRPGYTIKGYRLVCGWGSDECEYSFIIRGDAG